MRACTTSQDIYSDSFPGNYVDGDGDRKGDGWMVFMNLAVKSWRERLTARIAAMIGTVGMDAYFLDICGLWKNNLQGDTLLGMRTLVEDPARRFPGVVPIAGMVYDAQMGFIPMNHVARYPLYPKASFGKVASFNHLGWPAAWRGASGVHENGFRPIGR